MLSNPNLTAPPFVDGYPLPAVALNNLATLATTTVNILSFGASGDGIHDNTSAWNAATGALSGAGLIYFPEGKYRFNSALSFNFSTDTTAITIRGDGQDITELTWPNSVGTALSISMIGFGNSVHIRDLTFSTGTANQDIGIQVTQTLAPTGGPLPVWTGAAQNDFARVCFRSNEGYPELGTPRVTNFAWRNAINFNKVGTVSFDSLSLYGISAGSTNNYPVANAGVGISVSGASGLIATSFDFSRCTFSSLATGLSIGAYVHWTSVEQSHFVGCLAGVLVPPTTAGVVQLAIGASQFNCINGLAINSAVNGLSLNNNIFVQFGGSNTIGVNYVAPSSGTTINGNIFTSTTIVGGTGVILNGSGIFDYFPSLIYGNVFSNIYQGLALASNTSGAIVYGNIYGPGLITVSNAGSGNTIRGLPFATTTVTSAVSSTIGTRLTVSGTANFITGEYCAINDVSGIPHINSIYPVTVVDATHFDVPNPFSGSYVGTTSGTVTSLP